MGITRERDNETIECKAPKFDDYMCMSYDDFNSFYDTYVLGCAKWKLRKRARDEATPDYATLLGLRE